MGKKWSALSTRKFGSSITIWSYELVRRNTILLTGVSHQLLCLLKVGRGAEEHQRNCPISNNVLHRHFSDSKTCIKEATFLHTAGIKAKIKYILHFPTHWQLPVFVLKLVGKCFVKQVPIRKHCFFRVKHSQEHADFWYFWERYFPVIQN